MMWTMDSHTSDPIELFAQRRSDIYDRDPFDQDEEEVEDELEDDDDLEDEDDEDEDDDEFEDDYEEEDEEEEEDL